ncbi:MAG: hypothetical protein ICV64_04965 [Thermoleophilia bacterium]|nr:hypothetical protein [Thermoleophilia bacterium]
MARSPSVSLCIRCEQSLWPGEVELCPLCAVAVRVEYRRGLRELEGNLGRWSAFSSWLHASAR